MSTGGHPAADVRYRFVWDAPFTISPHDHNRIYTGSQHVHMTTDGGRSWRVISPDLTRNDTTRQQISGGLTPDNIGVEYGDVVYAIAESRLQPGLIWVGTNDGLVQVTRTKRTTAIRGSIGPATSGRPGSSSSMAFPKVRSATRTSSARIPSDGDCCTSGRRTRSTSPSTTVTTGSGCKAICRRRLSMVS